MKIDKNTEYSIHQIWEIKCFPWWKHHQTITKFIRSEMGRKMLKPIIQEVGKKRMYKIKGKYILKLLEEREKRGLNLS